MPREDLQRVLDYILNRADDAEFEVIVKACERRRRDGAIFARSNTPNPKTSARALAAQMQGQIGASVDGIRDMVRGFVADMIRKDAPEIPEADLEALLAEWVPDPKRRREKAKAAPRLPSDALVAMLRDFIDYSEGRMPPSRQKELWDSGGDWQDAYWKAFPPEIAAFLKAYLARAMDEETFWSAVFSVLGL